MKVYEYPCGCRWPVLEDDPPPGEIPFLALDTEQAPLDCPATWALLGKGLTKGVFQLESPLGRQWTKKLKPESLEHIGALGALLRPGCLKNVDEDGVSTTMHYVLRRHGQEPVKPYHPAVDAVLWPTYGVLAYQEQAMAIAVAVAGFSEQDADMLRKAIGKKLPEEMAKCKKMFAEGAAKAGVLTQAQAEEVFGWIEKSQRYSFNKSHSHCYGVLGYYSAYIKAHHPLAFFTAWLKNAKHKQDPQQEIFELINDARVFDISVEPPDLLTMEPDTHTDRRVVKFGLGSIKGIGAAQVGKLKAAVAAAGEAVGKPLREWGWYEFLTLFSDTVTSSVVTRLVQAGALRWMGEPRSKMKAEFDVWDALTVTERNWVRETGPYPTLAEALRALGNPRPQKHPTVRVPKKGFEQRVQQLDEEWAELSDRVQAIPDPSVPTPGEEDAGEGVDYPADRLALELRIMENREAHKAATRSVKDPTFVPYEGPFGGCATEARRQTVLSHLDLLVNPRSARVDNPLEIAYLEEELLGISITCSRVDSCDTSQVNCTCKEFLAGRTGFLMLGVEVQEVRELKTKSGKNPGSRYGRLTVSDGTCALEAVCWPDAWKEFKGLLNSEGSMVIVQGERDFKDKDSSTLIIRKVWQANAV